jgi:hypothetical protein
LDAERTSPPPLARQDVIQEGFHLDARLASCRVSRVSSMPSPPHLREAVLSHIRALPATS